MACDDITSTIHVRVDLDDRLIDWDYYKITCGRDINADGRLKALCLKQPIAQLAATSFDDVAAGLTLDDDDRFLLFLEWDALQNAISQYLGRAITSAHGRYQIAAIAYETDCVEIRQNVLPLTHADPPQTSACPPGSDCASCGM